ncbi:MAG: NAD(P)-dependent oxidoreductase [Woeseiaceae bacterium]|nr:NAD(P)-dependent oxidoreductase [Woeseiaceae bacterium]
MSKNAPDIKAGRLTNEEIEQNFSDLHPPLGRSEALIAADRCYFCYEAPCTTACPTGIDIPGFIQKIRSDNLRGSARTILEENIMGGMCARVCPTEVLCEEACVRNTHEDKPVDIGLLQRYATDPVFSNGTQLFERASSTGKRIAIVGGGPAGLACAHRLAMLGHDVVIFNRDGKLGGLNEYGIAAYKTVDNFAQREVDWILSIGGIDVKTGVTVGVDIMLDELRRDYDAVFVGAGLGDVNALGLDRETLRGVENAIDYIAALRQAVDKSALPVANAIVVIGGGMTAIDIAVQSKRLGADRVDIVYRRGPAQMGASRFEQDLARRNGVVIRHWARPVALLGGEHVEGVEFERTALDGDGRLVGTGERFTIECDVVFKAIGQALDGARMTQAFATERGKIVVDDEFRTSIDGVWAGGDCIAGGDDLTVSAVQHGKLAAHAIDRSLRAG